MKTHIFLIILLLNGLAYTQPTHHLAIGIDSKLKVPKFEAISSAQIGYLLQTERFGFEINFGLLNRFGKRNLTTSISNSYKTGVSFEVNLISSKNLKLGIMNDFNCYWSFFSYEHQQFYEDGPDHYKWKKTLSIEAPTLQYFIGPRLSIIRLKHFNIHSQLGLLFDNYAPFNFSLSKKVKLYPSLGFGISYQIPFSNNKNKQK